MIRVEAGKQAQTAGKRGSYKWQHLTLTLSSLRAVTEEKRGPQRWLRVITPPSRAHQRTTGAMK